MSHMVQKSKLFALMGLILLLTAFAAVQAPRITHNYPYMNYNDEGHIVRHAQNMFRAQTIDPHWYQYGSAMMNAVNLGVLGYVALSDDITRFRSTVKMYPNKYFENLYPGEWFENRYGIVDPPIFLVAGRIIVFFFGATGLILIFCLGRFFFSDPQTLLPPVILATIPILFQFQGYVHNDIPMATLLIGILLCSLLWNHGNNKAWLLLGGVLAGAATGFKYSGLLFTGLPTLFIITSKLSARQKLYSLTLLAFTLIAGIYITCPGFFGSEKEVFQTFLWDAAYYRNKGKTSLGSFGQVLDGQFVGIPLLLLAALGAVLLFAKRETRRVSSIMIFWASCFFLVFARYEYQPMRNLFVLFPFLALFASFALVETGRWVGSVTNWRVGAATTWGMAAILLFFLVTNSYETYAKHSSIKDSRIEITEWLLQNGSADGGKIAVASIAHFAPLHIAQLSNRYTVSVFDSTNQLNERADFSYLIIPEIGKSITALENDFKSLELSLVNEGRQIVFSSGIWPAPGYPNVFIYPNVHLRIYAGS